MEKVDLYMECSYLVTLKDDGYIEDGALAVKEGRFFWVGKRGEKEFEASEYLKLSTHIVLPAFVNTHTHAAMVGMRGLADDLPLKEWLENYIWPTETKLVSRDFIRVMVPLAILEMVKSGITTYADMYFFEDEAAKIVKDIGVRAVLGEGIIDFPTPSFKKPADALSFTREFIEEYKGDQNIIPAVAPHAPYSCSKELLLKSCSLAEEYGALVLIHVAETKWELEELKNKTGLTPFNYLERIGFLNERVVAAHAVWVSEEEIELIKNRGVGISHNPTSNMKLSSGFAPIPEYLKRGIKLGIGTDGAASNNNLDIMEEMHIASIIHKGFTGDPTVLKAFDIIKMATLGGARVLGMDNVIGSIEVGKHADFVAINIERPHLLPIFNPISHVVYSAKSSDIEYVFAFGKKLVDKGEVIFSDEREILKKAADFIRSI